MPKTKSGFTLVELLIVIVVIAILAAVTIVAYNGVQAKAQDSARVSDMTTIEKALELYYIDNGNYPNYTNYTPGSTKINSSWSTTADGSWQNLLNVLKPYAQNLPTAPPGTLGTTAAISGGNNYDYVGVSNSTYCASSAGQAYLLVYHMNGAQTNTTVGTCGGTQLGYYAASSNYRMVKN